ncbi:MAG: hypothetical protein Q9216_006151, partial [Gyalolechia sp. 2 TL-2023]
MRSPKRTCVAYLHREITDLSPEILTGATGTLGAHILHLLRYSLKVSSITCLVRAASSLAAHERVSKSLTSRGKPGLLSFSPTSRASTTTQDSSSGASHAHIVCLPATFSHPTLGLDAGKYTDLANTSTLIIHAAWAVNFTARLRSFEKDHIAGLSHLLSLSLVSSSHNNASHHLQPQRQPPRFLFLSSTASVTSSSTKDLIAERLSHSPDDASPLGYSRSKWVAEHICNNFHKRGGPSSHSSLPRPNIAVLRIGQLCGDTERGIWNMSEAYPLMLSTAPTLRALPDLGAMPLDWMPVDRAAEAVLQVAEGLDVGAAAGYGGGSDMVEKGEEEEVPVFHILNPHHRPTWTDLVE